MRDAQQDIIAELRRELEEFHREFDSNMRHMDLCRSISGCPGDEPLAVWLEDVRKMRNDMDQRWVEERKELKDAKKELSSRIRLDDPVVKGLVEAIDGLLRYSSASTDQAALAALAAYNARLKEVGCE